MASRYDPAWYGVFRIEMTRWLAAEPSLQCEAAWVRAKHQLRYPHALETFRRIWTLTRRDARRMGIQLPRKGRPPRKR